MLGERSDGFLNRKAELCDLPCSGHPVIHLGPEMLKRADALVSRGSLYHHQQLVLSLSISKGSVSHNIQDHGYSNVCLRWAPWSLTVEYETETPFLVSHLHFLKLGERPSYSRLLLRMKPGIIILNWRKKGSLCNGTILNLPGRKDS